MPQTIYRKGREKEYKLCKELRLEDFDIVQRSAGSHSPIDIFAIHRRKKLIKFIQSKGPKLEEYRKKKILKDMEYLSGVWMVEFELR